MSEIFAGCNFHKFHDKGGVRKYLILFAKFNMGGYKMDAVVSKTDFACS